MKIKKFKTIISVIAFIFIFLGNFNFSFAAAVVCSGDNKTEGLLTLPSLVICGRASGSGSCSDPCGLQHIGPTLNNFLYFIVYFAIMLIPVYIVYIGIKMVYSRGIPSELVEVRKLAGRVLLSIVLLFGGWIIIYTIITIMNVRTNIPSFMTNDGQKVTPGSLGN
jgi:hypothetical protein